jgi:polyferredoxin
LAVKAKRSSIRSRKRWTTLRKITQVLALTIFVIFIVMMRRGGWPPDIVNLPVRLDPLAMLVYSLASRALLLGSAVALITIALTLIFGRAWCGWLCPLGTILDLFSLKRWRGKRSSPSETWRAAKYVLLLTLLVAAIFGSLTLMIFDPITIMTRTLSIAVWPAADHVITSAEQTLYQAPFLQAPISSFDEWIRPGVLPIDPAYYRDTVLFAGIFAGLVLLNLFAQRFWCRYLCPLGGLLGLIGKVSIVRREVSDDCTRCAACSFVCPTGTIRGERHPSTSLRSAQDAFTSDPGECTMCLDCWAACPIGGVKFTAHRSPAAWNNYDPNRRQALIAIGTAITGIALLRSDAAAQRDHPRLIRPPGARENALLDKCVRCNACSRACPTSAIQPAIVEAGLEGWWTPVLVPRIGYCDYSCNACGQVCPVQAIPPLSLDEKRQRVIGRAYIDQNRCIAWADHRDCIVCEEMCPLPDKAIKLERATVTNTDGQQVIVQLPHVNRERCIGCGICEYKCPLNGEAAIRIYVPQYQGAP